VSRGCENGTHAIIVQFVYDDFCSVLGSIVFVGVLDAHRCRWVEMHADDWFEIYFIYSMALITRPQPHNLLYHGYCGSSGISETLVAFNSRIEEIALIATFVF
jgi:hypothetical protein